MKHGTEIARDVLEKGWQVFDENTMSKCWANFSKRRPPVLIGITSKERGLELGYVAMHRFLSQVGRRRMFYTAWLTRLDASFFDKLIGQGLVEEIPQTDRSAPPVYPHMYLVKKDPMESLREYAYGATRPQTDSDKGAGFDFEPVI